MTSPQLQNILQLLKNRTSILVDVGQARAVMDGIPNFFPTPADAEVESVDAGGVPAEWLSAPGADPRRVVYYLHGGGYVIGSLNSHRQMVYNISKASGARVLSVDYRLAPEHRFPAAVDDSVAGYRWLLSTGVDPKRVVIGGDSAGGGLTAATLVALRDAGDPLPAAGVCISPWTDLACTGDSFDTNAAIDPMISRDLSLLGAEYYLGDHDRRDPLASPLYADLAGLPPLLIHVGGDEVLLDDSTRLAERAKAAGVDATLEVWPEMFHVWHFFAVMLPEARQAIDRIGEYVRERTAAPAGAKTAAG